MLVSHFYEHSLLGLVLLAMVEAGHGRLFLRQSSTFDPSQIPTECQDVCNSVVDHANTCMTFQCLCTPANDAAVLSCVDCVTTSNHSSAAIIDGQDILNQFASECNLNSVSVSSLSASGVATVTDISIGIGDPIASYFIDLCSSFHSLEPRFKYYLWFLSMAELYRTDCGCLGNVLMLPFNSDIALNAVSNTTPTIKARCRGTPQASLQVLDPPRRFYEHECCAFTNTHDMLYQFLLFASAVIPFSTALPADAPAPDLVDFGKLDLSSTPQVCADACSAFAQQINPGCTADLKCLCTDNVGTALGPCFSCLAGIANTTQATTTAHNVLSQWTSICGSAGMTVTAPSFSALASVQSTASASASASAPSSSATGSASATSIGSSAAGISTASGTSSASASASASSKPDGADVTISQGTSALKLAVVAVFLAAFVI
ncbi:hypothetical protein B0H13DRAFT_2668624 [Mycena leptocephala]|nr:hypothetical protein B0H13DRAFT_2668624 [Mycena leptocephala]